VKVIQHGRRPSTSHFSIERLFADLRGAFPAGYDVHFAPCPHPSRGFLPRLRNVVRVAGDTADVHHIVGDVHYLAFGLPRERTVLTIHDCAALNRLRGLARAVLKHFWFSGPVSRAAVTTTISVFTKNELRQWLGARADQVQVVPNCVSSDFRFVPGAFNENSPVCLQVGTKWNKNLARVTEALRGTPCRLEIVGEVSEEQRGHLSASSVPFRVLGRLEDDKLREAYRRCDLVVFASTYEGFGLPILEAQATGRPVVTSNLGSMPEAAGDGALMVDPFSVEAIRAAVNSIRTNTDLRSSLIERGLANVRRFQPREIAQQYASIYERVGRR
jgi:glycosyltransferase involved in cell wall biosynthesis